jgi:hypothetical protein
MRRKKGLTQHCEVLIVEQALIEAGWQSYNERRAAGAWSEVAASRGCRGNLRKADRIRGKPLEEWKPLVT